MEKGKFSVLWMVLAVFLTAGLLWGLPEFSREKLEKTGELRREIRVLNLMNGLDLTQEQMEIILTSAREYQGLMARFEHILRNSQDEMEAVLAPLFSDMDDEEMKSHVETVYDDVRSLEDAEFEIQKECLAEELISPFKPEIPSGNVMRKIAGFLLSEEVITILEERLNQGDSTGERIS